MRPYRVCVVCTGNICRSPMGELLLREAFEEVGLGDRVVVDSAGTTSWEAGNPADRRTLATLVRRGHEIDGSGHRARQFDASWFSDLDLVLAADTGHLEELQRLARTDADRDKVRLLRSFDPASVSASTLEMDDPWYGDDTSFDTTYDEIRAAAPGVVAYVREQLGE